MYIKNKNIYYGSLFLLFGLFLYISCVDDVIVHPDTSEQSYLSVREAKSFFESNYTLSYSRNASTANDSGRLSPGNFTPLWEKSFAGSNSHVGSVEVPISPEYRYKAIRCDFKNGKAHAYIVDVSQKLIVMKSRHTEETAQYLLTLIPDKDYYRSHKGSISNSFHHTGEKNGYSGLVVYTHVVTSKIMAVGKYHDGILVSNVFLPSGKKTSESRISVAKALLDGILIPKFKLSASRSFGEEEIEIPGCIFCGQDACGCLVIVDDCQCGNCDLCGYDTTCFWCGMDPCVCDMYCPWCGMDPCECDDNSSGCGYCGDPNCNGECQDSGGNTGDNDGDDEQNKELNAKIESLNANEELKSRIKNLLDEFDKTQKQLENGWVRDRNTIHSPIEQKQNTLKYDWNNINKSVTEWYHLHPGGSPIPSFSDLITLASKHYNGYLDVDSFSYGIVTYFGATTLVVTSENKFDDFAERMQSNRNSIEILYNEFITDHFDNLTSDTAIEFSKVLDNMDSGLQLIFNSYNQTTKEWNGWEKR